MLHRQGQRQIRRRRQRRRCRRKTVADLMQRRLDRRPRIYACRTTRRHFDSSMDDHRSTVIPRTPPQTMKQLTNTGSIQMRWMFIEEESADFFHQVHCRLGTCEKRRLVPGYCYLLVLRDNEFRNFDRRYLWARHPEHLMTYWPFQTITVNRSLAQFLPTVKVALFPDIAIGDWGPMNRILHLDEGVSRPCPYCIAKRLLDWAPSMDVRYAFVRARDLRRIERRHEGQQYCHRIRKYRLPVAYPVFPHDYRDSDDALTDSVVADNEEERGPEHLSPPSTSPQEEGERRRKRRKSVSSSPRGLERTLVAHMSQEDLCGGGDANHPRRRKR